MLRNRTITSQQLLKQLLPVLPQRLFHQQNTILYSKSVNLSRQGRIMGKLFGQRVRGSKKLWFPSTVATNSVRMKDSHFGKSSNTGGKNEKRRMAVLNKLFMEHVTDLMATGEISERILGKGLQISRLKVTQDFAIMNVFWVTTGDSAKDAMLEEELQRCTGLLRHELTQLRTISYVPRIKFVKDKLVSNVSALDSLFKNMDFGSEEEENDNEIEIDFRHKHRTETLVQEFYARKTNYKDANEQLELKEADNFPSANLPEMRQDILGLDHKDIVFKILTKMRKSKQAWDLHLQNKEISNLDSGGHSTEIPSATYSRLEKANKKLEEADANSEKFEAFLVERRKNRNRESKHLTSYDQYINEMNEQNEDDYIDEVLSKEQFQIYKAEDFLPDEIDNEK